MNAHEETRVVVLHYTVTAGQDAGRVGVEMAEVFGDEAAWFMERMALRPRLRWQTHWVVRRGTRARFGIASWRRWHERDQNTNLDRVCGQCVCATAYPV